jgi:indole-3-glycerol phosphate synthase
MRKSDILKEIVAKKKQRIELAKQQLPEEVLKTKIQALGPVQSFIKAINKPRSISLIAEIKKQSPSRGILREDFNPQEIARIYQECGVQAISVLTEEDYFAGADAILLIADLLSKEKLLQLMKIAGSLGLDCLVEAHTERELKKALSLNIPLIGINNRDLRTLEVDLKITEKLFLFIPKDKVVVVESGIKSYQDILFLKILGVNAVLIGEAFMQAEDIKARVNEIMGW